MQFLSLIPTSMLDASMKKHLTFWQTDLSDRPKTLTHRLTHSQSPEIAVLPRTVSNDLRCKYDGRMNIEKSIKTTRKWFRMCNYVFCRKNNFGTWMVICCVIVMTDDWWLPMPSKYNTNLFYKCLPKHSSYLLRIKAKTHDLLFLNVSTGNPAFYSWEFIFPLYDVC